MLLMVIAMATVDEYRRYADECMESAKLAKTEPERLAFLQMAQAWLGALMSEQREEHPASPNGQTSISH